MRKGGQAALKLFQKRIEREQSSTELFGLWKFPISGSAFGLLSEQPKSAVYIHCCPALPCAIKRSKGLYSENINCPGKKVQLHSRRQVDGIHRLGKIQNCFRPDAEGILCRVCSSTSGSTGWRGCNGTTYGAPSYLALGFLPGSLETTNEVRYTCTARRRRTRKTAIPDRHPADHPDLRNPGEPRQSRRRERASRDCECICYRETAKLELSKAKG